jgi:MYXO-CTERM domain-containing protein
MTATGTVSISIGAGAAVDGALNASLPSTSTDDTVTFTAASGPFCGDGIVQPGEECDDGNQVYGDGCSACMIDKPGLCTPGATFCPDPNNGNGGCSSSPNASGFGMLALMAVALLTTRRRRRA